LPGLLNTYVLHELLIRLVGLSVMRGLDSIRRPLHDNWELTRYA